MITQQPVARREYWIQNTKNTSFIDVHNQLASNGIKNNSFFLVLLDPALNGIDPRDPRLNLVMKQRILRECYCNYWYFIRECVRIPDQGGAVNSGIPYKLHRGNLALNFCIMLNFNVFAEFPRQHGKTIAVVCRLLWEFLFGTRNSEIAFLNKKHEDSKLNLTRLKDIRHALPEYLRMENEYGVNNQKIKSKSSAEMLENKMAGNKIKTLPAARTASLAMSLGRGCTQPRQWYDEYAFILHVKDIYMSATPAYSRAALNAKANGAPYGIIITTTPGVLTSEEGLYAFHTKEAATPFKEQWYDLSKAQLDDLLAKNDASNFVYIRYTYQELGSTEQWFAKIVKDLQKDWTTIRREVLLEWAQISDNCPFSKDDLAIVSRKIKQPISTWTINNYYTFNIYERIDPTHVPIIGVDVSGGLNRDSSTITIIDSVTTRVIADFNCNYISPLDLAKVLQTIVMNYMPNAVINVERNGGFGASVLKYLIGTSVKKNLYYEIKEKVLEERFNGNSISKYKKMMKVYGFDNTNKSREGLMEILRQRMLNHKDKFISPILFNEIKNLEIKKNGRIDHSANGHDDQVFSYLLALYVWYEGKDLMNRWHIQKCNIATDDNNVEELTSFDQGFDDITTELIGIEKEEDPAQVEEQLKIMEDRTKLYNEWKEQEAQKDRESLNELLRNKLAREAYAQKYNLNVDQLNQQYDNGLYTISNDIFEDFYN